MIPATTMPTVAPADKPPVGESVNCWEEPDVGGGGGGGEELVSVVAACGLVDCNVGDVKTIPVVERGVVGVVALETDDFELDVDTAWAEVLVACFAEVVETSLVVTVDVSEVDVVTAFLPLLARMRLVGPDQP